MADDIAGHGVVHAGIFEHARERMAQAVEGDFADATPAVTADALGFLRAWLHEAGGGHDEVMEGVAEVARAVLFEDAVQLGENRIRRPVGGG